jgi:subtilisin family serine protease
MNILRLSSKQRLLAALIASIGASSTAMAASAALDQYVPGRVLVEANDGVSAAELDKIINVPGHKRQKLGQSNVHVLELPGNGSEQSLIARLKHNPHLKFAELDRLVESTMALNDPYVGSAWHLNKIGATTAWDATLGAGVTIAILDSGVEAAHPDLAPNLVAGYNVYDRNTNLTDVCGHGTSVAGAAGAASNNALGVASIAGRARIMPVRVAYKKATDGGCYASYSTVASGITWAADHGARIANVSYGGVSTSSAVTSAANYLRSKGGLVFASAGNTGGNPGYAVNNALIMVGATDSADNRASWSSYGNYVSLSAPGVGIWSTRTGAGYAGVNGTSYASPVAAGVAALMMSAAPSLTAAKIESLLYSTALDLGTTGRDQYFGYGRVNAAAAVQAARAAAGIVTPLDTTRPTAAISTPLGSSSVSGLVAVNVNAADTVAVTRVELKANGVTVATDTAAPYAFSWNSAGVANGMANLVAVAYDAAGNAGTSATVAVNVANAAVVTTAVDTIKPLVDISNPVAGDVTGTVTVSVVGSDNNGAAGLKLQLIIDNVSVATGAGAAMSYSWRTDLLTKGTHQLWAVARDAAGNATSKWVNVTVR